MTYEQWEAEIPCEDSSCPGYNQRCVVPCDRYAAWYEAKPLGRNPEVKSATGQARNSPRSSPFGAQP